MEDDTTAGISANTSNKPPHLPRNANHYRSGDNRDLCELFLWMLVYALGVLILLSFARYFYRGGSMKAEQELQAELKLKIDRQFQQYQLRFGLT